MKNLFKSQTSFELLDLLTGEPDSKFYLSELSKKLTKDPANIIRELSKLEHEDLVVVSVQNGKKYYSFNLKNSIAREIIKLFAKTRSSDFKNKFDTGWLLAEEIVNICPFFCQLWLNAFVDEFAKPGGKAYKKIAAIFKDYNLWFYYDKKDADEVGEHIVNKFVGDPKFMDEVNDKIVEYSDKLNRYVDRLPEEGLNKYSNKELWDFYKGHDDIHTEYYQWGWLPVAADMFCNNLGNRGKKILEELGVKKELVDEYLVLLTQPTTASLLKIEQDELIKIGIKVQKNQKEKKLFSELFKKFKEEDAKLFGLYTHSPEYEQKLEEKVRSLKKMIRPDILSDLQKHYTKYFYTKFLFTEEQGVYGFDYYLKSLVRLVASEPNLEKAFDDSQAEFKALMKSRDELIKKLKLSGKLLTFFTAWGGFMVTKIYRRYAQIFAIYKMTFILSEIAKRLGLTLKQARFMTIEETERALLNGVVDVEEIRERVSFCVYYADKNEHTFYTNSSAKNAVSLIQAENISKVREVQGQCGCRGSARGIARIVNVVADIQKIEKGEILVSISTQPDLLPAMKKAAAFVTDQGGVTSHAAIVAREMNTPCVIGTKIATKVIKDGDEIELDADKGIVKIIKKA